MEQAIEVAERCRPIADRIPKVGAVISVRGTTIASGHRGTGLAGDDDHAEKVALSRVSEKSDLPDATLYTTLEPCTREVRSKPLECCTELVLQSGIKRVFIGILDPNQGVRGKGLWELQDRGVEVELFPPDLAARIRAHNEAFIREQRSLGIRITNVSQGQVIRTWDKGGVFQLAGSFTNPPGPNVFAIVNKSDQWWPQPYSLTINEENRWSVKVHFGAYGEHVLSIVQANQLGIELVEYYRKIVRLAVQRKMIFESLEVALQERDEVKVILGNLYPGIELGALPKGLELQAQVEVFVQHPPA